MTQQIKNIVIFVSIGAALILAYIFFFRPSSEPVATLVSSTGEGGTTVTDTTAPSSVGSDFLTLLLSVKNIKLNDKIFSDPAYASLHDSSISLSQDTPEGRPNPFAPFGTDTTAPAITEPASEGAATSESGTSTAGGTTTTETTTPASPEPALPDTTPPAAPAAPAAPDSGTTGGTTAAVTP